MQRRTFIVHKFDITADKFHNTIGTRPLLDHQHPVDHINEDISECYFPQKLCLAVLLRLCDFARLDMSFIQCHAILPMVCQRSLYFFETH